MDSSNPGPLLGRFKAENAENILKAYRIVMDVKETGKSYILQLVEFESRYSASHISHLFSKSKRVVLRKAKGGHAIRKWGDGTFTFYPFQAGIPFYFEKLSTDAQGEATPEHGGVDNRDVCESRACAYNRDGICRFSLVHDRPPNMECASMYAGPYFSHPFSMRWLVGAKLLGGCEIYKPCRTDFRRLERRAGFSFGTGLSTTYLATQNLGVRFSTDYDVAPPVVRSSRERLHKLTFSMEVCAVF